MNCRHRHTRNRGFAAKGGTLGAVVALCLLCAQLTPAWGLTASGDAPETSQGLVVDDYPSSPQTDGGPAAFSGTDDLLKGQLHLGFGSGQVEFGLFSRTGRLLRPRSGDELDGLPGWGFAGLGAGRVGRASPGAGVGDVSDETEAASYRMSYRGGSLHLQGSVLDVGTRFSASQDALRLISEEDAERLRNSPGTRATDLQAAFGLAPGASLTSHRKSLLNDKPGDERRGLTTVDTGHALELGLGGRSRLIARLGDHSEEWARELGKPGLQRRTRAVELESDFGGEGRHSLRLGLTSTQTRKGDEEQSQRAREAHLKLSPAKRLRLNADYVAKGSGEGSDQTTRTVGAVLELTSDAQLAAALNTLTPEDGGETRESTLKLSTKLGGGGSAGQLEAEERVARSDGAGMTKNRKWALTGGLGAGAGKTNLRMNLQEKRAEGPSGKLERTTLLHMDRALGSHLKLTAERHQRVGGTNAGPETTVRSSCELAAELGPKTKLGLGLVSEQKAGGTEGWARRVSVGHGLGEMQLRAEQSLWREGEEGRSAMSYGLDAPTGELPEWAAGMSEAHEFSEAPEYLVRNSPNWTEMPFAGYRVWAKRRRGGEDDGRDSLTLGHRRVIGGRYHLRLAYQEHPEAKEGEQKGRPMPVRRKLVEIGMPIWRGLAARGSCQRETSLATPGLRGHGMTLGLWGRLSDREQVEASVSRDRGSWEEGTRDRTSVSLLYSLHISEEHRVHVKVGYGWGEGEAGDRQREGRVSMGYVKPI